MGEPSARPPRRDRAWAGTYFDGRSALRQQVTIMILRGGLRLVREDDRLLWWPYEDIRLTQGTLPGEQIRLERGGETPEVLVVPDAAFLAALQAATPRLLGRVALAGRRVNWILVGLLAGAASVVVGLAAYLWGIPRLADTVASRIPLSWEERLGEAVVEHVAPPETRCADPGRLDVLNQILRILTAAGPPSPHTFRLMVTDGEIVNAFAAPGGYIIVNVGLLRKTSRPEELAGVLAHEIQHVLQRHGTKALFRELSLRVLIAAMAGDAGALSTALEPAGTLGGLRYRRSDEEAADREGMRLLHAARIDPRGMVDFYQVLMQEGVRLPQVLEYLSTHPDMERRIEQLKRWATEGRYAPVRLLPEYPWNEIGKICQAR